MEEANVTSIIVVLETVNGAAPPVTDVVGKKSSSKFCSFNQIGGGYFADRTDREYCYSGFDVEIGSSFFENDEFTLYAAAGPYYFERSNLLIFGEVSVGLN